MKTIQMTIDPHLLKAVDRLTRARKANISPPISHLSASKMHAVAGATVFALGLVESKA
jgi:hypothetical protein